MATPIIIVAVSIAAVLLMFVLGKAADHKDEKTGGAER